MKSSHFVINHNKLQIDTLIIIFGSLTKFFRTCTLDFLNNFLCDEVHQVKKHNVQLCEPLGAPKPTLSRSNNHNITYIHSDN